MTGTTESGRCFTARSRVACKGLGKGCNRQDQRCDDKQARCANPIPHLLVPTVTFSVRLHMTHSKVRVSPADPDVTSETFPTRPVNIEALFVASGATTGNPARLCR